MDRRGEPVQLRHVSLALEVHAHARALVVRTRPRRWAGYTIRCWASLQVSAGRRIGLILRVEVFTRQTAAGPGRLLDTAERRERLSWHGRPAEYQSPSPRAEARSRRAQPSVFLPPSGLGGRENIRVSPGTRPCDTRPPSHRVHAPSHARGAPSHVALRVLARRHTHKARRHMSLHAVTRSTCRHASCMPPHVARAVTCAVAACRHT